MFTCLDQCKTFLYGDPVNFYLSFLVPLSLMVFCSYIVGILVG